MDHAPWVKKSCSWKVKSCFGFCGATEKQRVIFLDELMRRKKARTSAGRKQAREGVGKLIVQLQEAIAAAKVLTEQEERVGKDRFESSCKLPAGTPEGAAASIAAGLRALGPTTDPNAESTDGYAARSLPRFASRRGTMSSRAQTTGFYPLLAGKNLT